LTSKKVKASPYFVKSLKTLKLQNKQSQSFAVFCKITKNFKTLKLQNKQSQSFVVFCKITRKTLNFKTSKVKAWPSEMGQGKCRQQRPS